MATLFFSVPKIRFYQCYKVLLVTFVALCYAFTLKFKGNSAVSERTMIKSGISAESFCYGVLAESQLNNTESCRLHQYDVRDTVFCIDQLGSINFNVTKRHMIRLVFMGDSRMRQQFHTFTQMLPVYDLDWSTPDGNLEILMTSCHCDMSVKSQILNLEVLFKWRPIIDESLIEELRHWPHPIPLFILIGINAHHLLTGNHIAYPIYEQQLIKLSRSVKQLSISTNLLWMMSQPILDDAVGNYNFTPDTFDIHSEKVLSYNTLAEKALKDSGVNFFHATVRESFEYIRGCHTNQRDGDSPFIQCTDRIHLGNIVNRQATQVLINFLCNRIV